MVWQNCAGTAYWMKAVDETDCFDTKLFLWYKSFRYELKQWNCTTISITCFLSSIVCACILLHEKFLQFDWLRAVVFQLNLKYLHVKYSPYEKYSPQMFFLYVWVIAWFVCNIWHKYHSWYFKIVSNFTLLTAREITYNRFEISLVVFKPNITTNKAITCTYKKNIGGEYILVI